MQPHNGLKRLRQCLWPMTFIIAKTAVTDNIGRLLTTKNNCTSEWHSLRIVRTIRYLVFTHLQQWLSWDRITRGFTVWFLSPLFVRIADLLHKLPLVYFVVLWESLLRLSKRVRSWRYWSISGLTEMKEVGWESVKSAILKKSLE